MSLSIVTSLLSALFPPRCEAIAELTIGRRAMVRGKVVARDLIASTLTGERCVYYHYAVKEFRESNVAGLANEGHWDMIRFDEAIVEFYLQDESGDRVIVCPQNVRVDRARGIAPTSIDMGIIHQRAQELVIRPGALLEVQGVVATVHDLFDEDRNYRTPPTRFMLSAPSDDEHLDVRVIASERV